MAILVLGCGVILSKLSQPRVPARPEEESALEERWGSEYLASGMLVHSRAGYAVLITWLGEPGRFQAAAQHFNLASLGVSERQQPFTGRSAGPRLQTGS